MTSPQHIPQPSPIGRGIAFAVAMWLIGAGAWVGITAPPLTGAPIATAVLASLGALIVWRLTVTYLAGKGVRR